MAITRTLRAHTLLYGPRERLLGLFYHLGCHPAHAFGGCGVSTPFGTPLAHGRNPMVWAGGLHLTQWKYPYEDLYLYSRGW